MKRILIATLVILSLFLAIGFMLPGAWHAERSVVIRAPASAIFPYLNSFRQWRDWVVWYQRHPDMQVEYSGADAGVGATSRWSDENGRAVMKIMQSEHNRLVAYATLRNGGELRADGTLALLPEGKDTRVVWSAAGEVGRNIANRYLALFLGSQFSAEFADSLDLLKQKLETKSGESTAHPRP